MSTSDLLRDYQTLLNEIKAKEEKVVLIASLHFANIRSKIKTQQGYLKKSCDTIALKLIDKVDEFEKLWLEKLTSITLESTKVEYECVDELKKMKLILEEKLKTINSIEFDIEKYTFESKHVQLSSNILGSLNFNTYIPLAVSAFNGTIKTFNIDSGKCLRTLTGHKSYISSIKEISNNQIATSSWDNSIRIWDISAGKCVRVLEGHKSWVQCLKCHNGMLISGSGDNTIKLWEIETGSLIRTLMGHNDYISVIKVLADNRLLSGSGDNTIILWELGTGELLRTFKGHTNWITALKIIKNERIITGSWEDRNSLKIWNINTSECLKTMDHHSWITCIKTDKTMFATASNNSITKVWNMDSLDYITTLIGHKQAVVVIKFIEDGKLLTGSRDGHVESITSIKIWPDFQFLSGSEDGCVKIFNWKLLRCTNTLMRPKDGIIKNKCLLYLLNKKCIK